MADIFLSYSQNDIEQAAYLARCLEGEGWTVFWDRDIPPGKVWPDVLDAELVKSRCVVVLWTRSSVNSEWVQYEAGHGRGGGILVPARGEATEPPTGFDEFQAADLVGWAGDTKTSGYHWLLRTIRDLIGGHAEIRLALEDVVLVTGEKKTHEELGPTINMTCKLTNDAKQPVLLNRLELLVTEKDQDVYQMIWNLLYDTAGYQHIEVNEEMEIPIDGRSTWSRGVQFREPRKQKPNVWPVGAYDFELLGWASRRHPREQPNIVTRFRGNVTPGIMQELEEWRNASSEVYDRLGDPDRAYGVRLAVRDVREGL